jgi:hypothetical protein
MTNIKTVTTKDFSDIIKSVKGVMFANVTYFVDESGSRTINGKKALQKSVTVNVTINADYEKKVNRILENKQGETPDFESMGMKGKSLVYPDCRALVQNDKGEQMLYAMIEHNAKREVAYYYQGELISKELAKEKDLFSPSFFAEKKTVGRGSVSDDNDFAVFTVFLKNIKRAKFNGMEYIII